LKKQVNVTLRWENIKGKGLGISKQKWNEEDLKIWNGLTGTG
jgi:hypothetical protein